MYIGRRCISLILIVCHVFMFMGCYTTKNFYEDVARTPDRVDIISHQNKAGALFYTLRSIWINSEGKFEHFIYHEFPYSTYSDAVMVRDELINKEVIIRKKVPEKTEKVFSPVKTGLAIGLPILGVVTLILSIIFVKPSEGTDK